VRGILARTCTLEGARGRPFIPTGLSLQFTVLALLFVLALCTGCRETSRLVAGWEGAEGRISGDKLRVKVSRARYFGSLAALGLSAADLEVNQLVEQLGTPTEMLQQKDRCVRTFVVQDDSGQTVSRLDAVSDSRLYRLALTVEEPAAALAGRDFTWGNFPLLASEKNIRKQLGKPNLPEPPTEHALTYSFFVDRTEGRVFLLAEYHFSRSSDCPYSVTVSIYYEAE